MTFDFQNPDYDPIWIKRRATLARLRANPSLAISARAYYREHIADFITDWGITIDPRNVEVGRPALMPFILFAKQREWIEWILERWRAREPGLTEKSRDGGLSWLAIAFSCSMCMLYEGMVIGFGSKKEELVDKLGAPKSLFYKARQYMEHIPHEFRGSWDLTKHAPHMRVEFPDTQSIISGEAGDQIGRGDRTSIYFVDEAAHLERPQLTDASLSATTNCRQDISSVNGPANSFAEKRRAGKIKVFTFPWQDDPRKGAEWYAKQCEALDPIIVAQEIDINYSASIEGIVIPSLWVQAALDAHVKLGLKPTGLHHAALDVADKGKDKNALGIRHGNVLTYAESWAGSDNLDIFHTTERAFLLCDLHKLNGFDYDADGLGASVRGDARKINEARKAKGQKVLVINPFLGSGAVKDPNGQMVEGRTNEDFFENFKAQSWWSLRFRFQETWRAIQGMPCKADNIISIAKDFPERARLCVELSQPIYGLSKSGKILIDKAPEGVASPNLADAVMMVFSPKKPAMIINPALLESRYVQPHSRMAPPAT